MSTTGTVITNTSPLNARSGPGTSYSVLGAFPKGGTVTINETKSGWHKVTGTGTSGSTLTDVWVYASYIKVSDSNSTANVSKSDGTVSSTGTTETPEYVNITNDVYEGNFTNFVFDNTEGVDNKEYYRQLADKYAFALGAPIKYNMDIDIQYADEYTSGYGRVMNKTMMSGPSVLSICPGKVKMFPYLFGTKRDGILNAALAAATGLNDGESLKNKINQDTSGVFSDKTYAFNADTATYAKYLNALCRASAIMLGVGDEAVPYNGSKAKDFDYAYWTIRKKYLPGSEGMDSDKSIFKNFWPGLVQSAEKIIDTAVSDTSYINFFLNGSETSVSESITTSVSDSPLASALNAAGSISSTLNYFTGSGFSVSDADAMDAIKAVFDSGDSSVMSGLINIGENMLKGGRMVVPKMLEGASYGRSISCSLKFISPYGDKLSVFLKCIVPICHLMALALPKQVSDNMYTYPFVIRATQIGHFTVELGVISSITITRGGSDDTSWTNETVSTEWDVQLEITPLIDELMITSTSNPLLLVKNEGLLDYLSNFCGFDMIACNLGTKLDMMSSFFVNKITKIPNNIGNVLSDYTFNKLNAIFRM